MLGFMPSAELKIVEFGPCRAIGVNHIGDNRNNELPRLWHEKLLPRISEIDKPADGVALGVCRCVAGATEGRFEYIAAFQATETSPVPAGMMELRIPRCHYAIFEVAGLADLPKAWTQIQAAMPAQKIWEGCCGPKGCECATHPSFEYYPPTFGQDGKLLLYVPVKRAG